VPVTEQENAKRAIPLCPASEPAAHRQETSKDSFAVSPLESGRKVDSNGGVDPSNRIARTPPKIQAVGQEFPNDPSQIKSNTYSEHHIISNTSASSSAPQQSMNIENSPNSSLRLDKFPNDTNENIRTAKLASENVPDLETSIPVQFERGHDKPFSQIHRTASGNTHHNSKAISEVLNHDHDNKRSKTSLEGKEISTESAPSPVDVNIEPTNEVLDWENAKFPKKTIFANRWIIASKPVKNQDSERQSQIMKLLHNPMEQRTIPINHSKRINRNAVGGSYPKAQR
jgi:hypothetical protein